MMRRIYNDLKNNIKSIYQGYNVITINNYFHHSFKYPEMLDLFKKYGGNSDTAQKELQEHISLYEIQPHKPEPRRINSRTGLMNDFFIDFDSIINEEMKKMGNSDQIFQSEDMAELMGLAQNFEIKKIQRKAQESGQVMQPDDISIQSVLRAIVEISLRNPKYSHINKLLKLSKFDIEKFIKDDESGKSDKESIINKFCTNLNEKAQKGKIQPVIGREIEIEQLVNILKKARKNNPVLTGKAGVGKTAIVEGLAKRIQEGNVPTSLKNAVVYELQVMNMVKGTSFRGQFEQNMSDLLEEFKQKEESGELPILFIDELHTIMGAGSAGQGGLDFSNIIKPALARGELRTIGATTKDEWYKFIKENPALDRRFVSVFVAEPTIEDAYKIIYNSLNFYEKAHSVKYDKGTVERAIELSVQFIVDNALPDKAFDLIDYAGAMNSVLNKKTVSVEDIEKALARHKNIDYSQIIESKRNNLEPLSPRLKKIIFGQDVAVETVSKPVQKALAGLNAKDKPYGVFLFTGPTGTGKTELAKQIANEMKANFHRIDMSEYQEKHSVSKLIGSPAGYVGYDDGSSLTKVINEHPRTVLLLDEIEKAHPDIFKLFLQVMDYGKLTDSKGREINFKNVLIIMTSNAGVTLKGKAIGIGSDLGNNTSKIDEGAINSLFPPEFRGRLTTNGPIEFKPLNKETLKLIINKYINEIQLERLNKLNIQLKLENPVVDKIANIGLEKGLGARPIKEFIESSIIDNLTDEVLFGKLKNLHKKTDVLVVLEDDIIKLKY